MTIDLEQIATESIYVCMVYYAPIKNILKIGKNVQSGNVSKLRKFKMAAIR